MKIMITGSSGFVGSNLVPALQKYGHEIIGVNLSHGDLRANKSYLVDLTNVSEVQKLFSQEKPDCIIHLAAKATPKDDKFPTKIIDTNIKATHNLLEYCPNGCRFLFASSIVVYDEREMSMFASINADDIASINPKSTYGATKAASELLVNLYTSSYDKICGVNMRLPAIVGPNLTHGVVKAFCERLIHEDKFTAIGDEPGPHKPYLHVSDLITAILILINNKTTGSVDICPCDTISIKEVAESCMAGLNIHKPIEWLGQKAGWRGDNEFIWHTNISMVREGWYPLFSSIEAVTKTANEYSTN